VLHLHPIYVKRGKRGTNELRCLACKSEAEDSNAAHGVMGWVMLVLFGLWVLFVISMASGHR
jgi:hypothetical protein